MGSSCWMVVSACTWLAVTSAPGVTAETSMRPLMGATMRARCSCTTAASSAALATATSASARRCAAALSSADWRLMASAFSSSASRAAFTRDAASWASAFCSAAAVRARSASKLAASSWYSGWPAVTRLPSVNRRLSTRPPTCGRISACWLALRRPGSSSCSGAFCAVTVTTPTSGAARAAGAAGLSWQAVSSPASSKAAAARDENGVKAEFCTG